MYTTSTAYKTEIQKRSRTFECRVTIGDRVFTNNEVQSIDLNGGIQDVFSIGNTPSMCLELVLRNTTDTIFTTNSVKVEIGLKIVSTIEYIPLGIFNIEDIKKDDYTTKFTCYDNMTKFEIAYFSSLGDKPTLQQVVNELASKTGVQFTGSLPYYTVKKLEGFTCREVLGYVASLCGGNALITRDGKFTIVYPTDISRDVGEGVFDLQRDEVKYKVGKITCQVKEQETISKGSLGTDSMELSFENPWVTETILTDIYNRLNGFNYLGYTMKWQGDLSLDIGDIITYTDAKKVTRKLPILYRKLSYDGGLDSELSAKGETKNKNSFNSSGSMSNKLNRVVTEVAIVNKAFIDYANINDANIKNLQAETAKIHNLEVETANINNILAGNIGSGSIQTIHLTGKNVVIDNAVIKSAMIDSLDLSKLNAGTISTNKFRITSDNGEIEIVGATQQFKDKNNKVRIQMGQDTQGNFNFILRGADGTTTLIDHTGIKEKAIADDLIKSNMVAADAIGEKQINYSSLITGLNKDDNTYLIKASKVAIDLTGQSLEVAFNSLKSNVDNMEIGGRNLLLDSLKQVSNSEYCTAVYKFGNERLKEGEEVTIQIKGVLGDGKTNWWIFNSGAGVDLAFMGESYKGSDGVYRRTIKWKVGSSSNTSLYLYAFPSSASAVSSIEWVKLEKGNKSTDWTPAPEDIDQVTQNLQTQITANLKGIEALIKDTTITEGSTSTSLKDAYISLKATVNGLNSTVASHTSSISTVTTELGKVDGKINTAKSDAISTAGADATSKANNALSSAKSYTNAQITTVNTRVSNAESSITQLNNSITNKVWQTDIDKSISEIEIGGRNLLKPIARKGSANTSVIDNGIKIDLTTSMDTYFHLDLYNEALPGETLTLSFDVSGLEGTLSFGINNQNLNIVSLINGRVYKTFVMDKTRTAITIDDNVRNTSSNNIRLTNFKLEKGNKATDWTPAPEDIDESILAVSKEVNTVKEKAASLETSLNSITSKVTNLESTTSTINGKVTAQETRLQSTEQKVTATGVITTITEAINAGTNSITTMQFILDRNGATIKNGALKILNNAGDFVLHGDTSGNLIMRGVFEQFQNGVKSVDIKNNAVNLYDWSRDGDLVGGMIAVIGNTDGRGKAMVYGDQGNPLVLGYCNANRDTYYDVITIDDTKQANGNQTVIGIYDHEALFNYSALHWYGLDKTIPLGKITVTSSSNDLYILGKQNYNSVYIGEMTSSANTYVGYARINASGLYVWGDIKCSGPKTRLVPTAAYDGIKLNAYETADCYFADIGEGTIGEDGLCYVYIDPLLLETINTKCAYQVFIQAYGEGNAYPITREETFFVIKGTPGLKFGWELKAKQKDYETERLEREKIELMEQDSGESFLDYIDKEPDYDDFAIKYLKDYEEELIENG